MQPLQICIGPIIRIGRESWCLPYPGFFFRNRLCRQCLMPSCYKELAMFGQTVAGGSAKFETQPTLEYSLDIKLFYMFSRACNLIMWIVDDKSITLHLAVCSQRKPYTTFTEVTRITRKT